MATTHEVELRFGAASVRVGTWDELAITHDMLAPTSPWTVTLWREASMDPWPRTDLWPLVLVDETADVVVDGALQVRGFISAVKVTADKSGSPLTITGRDQAAVAQKADADPALSLRNVTLVDALERLFAPLGINVTVGMLAADARTALAGARPGARTTSNRRARRAHRVDQFRVKVGEKVWQLADQLCRRHGYLLYTAPSGDGVALVIDRPAYDAPVAYQFTRRRQPDGSYEGTILSGGRTTDISDVPSSVTVFGHAAVASREDTRLRVTVENEGLAHPRVAGTQPARPRYIRDDKARTRDTCEQRGRREIAAAMASFDVYEYTVQGLGQSGRLFAVNAMSRVDDDMTGVHTDCLITRVTMKRSRGGGHTALVRLVPRGAIVIEPDPDV